MLSPKKHINKKYVAELDGEVTQDMVDNFKRGITFRDGTECLPATLIPDENNPEKAQVIIGEGKFHQVKKMFITQGLRVKKLKRVSIGVLFCLKICHLASADQCWKRKNS